MVTPIPMKCNVCGRKVIRSADLRIGDSCNAPGSLGSCYGRFVDDLSRTDLVTAPEVSATPTMIIILFSPNCWAKFPKSFRGLSIPDDYIFNPDRNRTRINKWWRANLPNIEEML